MNAKPSMLDRARESQVKRQTMIDKYGFIPMSILQIQKTSLRSKIFLYQKENPERANKYTLEINPDDDSLADTADGVPNFNRFRKAIIAGRKQKDRMIATIMPPELVMFFLLYYCKPGDVYLDPFMGQGVQMQVSKLLGFDYMGYDVSQEFFGYIEATKRKIDDGKSRLDIYCADSRFPTEIPDGIGDFSFHSPPYWDIEYYGDEPEQLGTNHTYEEFLKLMQDVMAAWLPKFKPGAYHVVNVNDFRRDRLFYPYHADYIKLAQAAGWEYFDCWIIGGGITGLAKIFAVDFNEKKISPKLHEFALVFRKPKDDAK